MHHRGLKASLLLSVGMGGIVVATPALAQAADDSATGDIIVTARRTEERLQDVPISITVYNQEAIANRNIVVATDLATYTPSLSVNQKYGPEKAAFAIRGFTQDQSTSPTVGVYFADVVGVRAQGGTTSGSSVGAGAFMDLANVQVLKGPQGTLFGRNTTGGAVLLVPNKPTDRLEGYVEGQLGNYNLKRAMAVLNVPLADTFKVRLAVDRNHREGYMKNHSGIGPDDYNDVNYFAARLGILAELTPDLENYTVASYSNSFSHGYGAHYVYCDRRYVVGSPIFSAAQAISQRNATRTAPSACAQMDRADRSGQNNPYYVDINNPDPVIGIKQWQIINTTTWKASDSLTIKNIASYGEFKERSRFNLYSDNWFVEPTTAASVRTVNGSISGPFSPAGTSYVGTQLNPTPGEDNASQSTFTEELQFQGNMLDGRFIWQAGGYLELSRPLGWNAGYTSTALTCSSFATISNFQCASPFGFQTVSGRTVSYGQISYSATQYNFNNNGLYAQATFKFTDQLSLTGGFRYTFDKTYGAVESTRIQFLPNGNRIQVCNDALNFPDPATLPGTAASPPLPLIVNSRQQCHRELSVSSNKPTWLIDLDFKPTNDVLLYAKYARGYRQGGINFTNISVESWKPESVDAYEIGAKASFRGAVSGYFNVAGFYNKLKGQQLFTALVTDPRSGLAGGAGIFNAGRSRIQGVEVDASATFFDSLRFDIGYTYLDTKVISVAPVTPFYPYAQFIALSKAGDPLTLSPKNRLTATATYTVPTDESIGKISLSATFVHTDKQLANGSSNPTVASDPAFGLGLGNLPATDILNLNVNWNRVLGSPIDAAVFVTNVTDEVYPVNVLGSLSTNGAEAQLMGMPRMWGFRLRYNFGQ